MTQKVEAIVGVVAGATATTAAVTTEALKEPRQNLFEINWEIPYTLINISVHEIVGLVGLSLSIFFAIRLYRNKGKD